MADPPLRYHWLRLRATVHPTEDPLKVRRALRACSGLEPEAFEDKVEATEMEAFHGGRTEVLEVGLDRAGEIRAALRAVLDRPTRERLRAEAERRLDDDCVFYFRLDKQAALAGDLQLTDGDDAVQARLRLEVHPVRRENALAALQRLLDDGP